MRCPYCAEEVKDEAVVCKHCQSELFVVKPLLQKINEMTARLTQVEVTAERAVEYAAAEASGHVRHAPPRHHGRGLSALECFALTYITLIVVHFLINVKFDLKLIYFQISSIVLPLIFGLLWRESERKMLSTGLLLGLAIAVTTIVSELAVISAVEKAPFLPKDAYEWKELAFHSASMAFGFLTGVLLASNAYVELCGQRQIQQDSRMDYPVHCGTIHGRKAQVYLEGHPIHGFLGLGILFGDCFHLYRVMGVPAEIAPFGRI